MADPADGPQGGVPTPDQAWSTPDLLALLRQLHGAQATDDPISQFRALVAQDARLPSAGGLFGSGYAQYMADNAPPLRVTGAALTPGAPPLNASDASAAGATPSPDASPAVATGAGTAPAPVNAPDSSRAEAAQRLATSPQGQAFIRSFEAVDQRTKQPHFDIYDDRMGNLTFGYGHKVEGDEHAALQAKLGGLDQAGRAALIEQMFRQDLATAEQRVRDRIGPEALKSLNQAQFDALVADAFNAGGGGALGPKMLQNIWDGDLAAAGRQFDAITGVRNNTREIVHGLTRRSLAEAAMFNRGDYDYQPSQQEMDALEAAKRRELAAKDNN